MIIFSCDRCQKETEYQIAQLPQIGKDAKGVGQNTICVDCFKDYGNIGQEAQKIAEEARKRLEDQFFSKPEQPTEPEEDEAELEELLKEDYA